MAAIEKAENSGNFDAATRMIDRYIAQQQPSVDTVYDLYWRKEKMRRIELDFHKSKDDVLKYVRRYYPSANDDSLAHWESAGTMEFMLINGEKRYFDRAAPNLFRLDPAAIARKAETMKDYIDAKTETLKVHLPAVVNAANRAVKSPPHTVHVKYTLTLAADAVPDGETVRCWLPYPRSDHHRQTNVKLLAVNDSNYIISPSQYAHSSLYMEKTARADSVLTFACEFSFQTTPEWYGLEHRQLSEYDKGSAIYRKYTAERPPHILFSDSIKAISKRIVGDETNPYRKVRKIFEWVDAAFPWAGAREYCTIDNIPAYVLHTRHGDCGQVTLLFMTLARYNGIPTRWQSGFMVHPHSENLHDWCEYYIEGIGWIPLDQSFGVNTFADSDDVRYFYSNGMDAYRWIVNSDCAETFFPAKLFPRSDNVDFQRGELEWRGGNIYYDLWDYNFDVTIE
jgi:transglutaminase-like putative cysteine protease